MTYRFFPILLSSFFIQAGAATVSPFTPFVYTRPDGSTLTVNRLPGLQSDASFPAFGEQKALVILVEYQDVRFELSEPREYFDRLLNEEGFADFGATGSARDFFTDNSNGLFLPRFDVYGPVLLDHERAYYGGNDYYYHSDKQPEMMAIEACSLLDASVDFTEYDRDGDGTIDNVFIFFAGRGEPDGGGDDAVWPHSAKLTSWIETPIMFDGVRLDGYGCACEKETGLDRPASIGTFVHEFCHILGLPDLYPTYYSGSYTPGPFSTMDQGPYNNEGRTPPLLSSFERAALGWIEPKPLESDGTYMLNELGETNEAYLITSGSPDEYYLLENRQQRGWDSWLPGHGMLVWHVRYDEEAWNSFSVNNDPYYQRVDLIEADNSIYSDDRSGHPFPGINGVTAFGSVTTPRMEFDNPPEVSGRLSEITETDGLITFRYSTEMNGISPIKSENGAPQDFLVDGQRIEALNPLTIYSADGKILYRMDRGDTQTIDRKSLLIIQGPTETRKLLF